MKTTSRAFQHRLVAPRFSRRAPSRRGVFMIVVVVCLIVSGMLLASLFKTALLHERQLVYEQYRAQAGWLAQAGLERAAARLALAPDYDGEAWDVSPESFGGGDSAVVVIHVLNEESDSSRRTIRVEAVFPSGAQHQARLTRLATVSLSQEL